MRFQIGLLLVLIMTAACAEAQAARRATRSLAGTWAFQLDPAGGGENAQWFGAPLSDTIQLPGTTDEAHKGERNTNTQQTDRLSRVYPYVGQAWYQREIEIPAEWAGRRITLYLERTKSTMVWVDNRAFGELDSLVAPHVFDLTDALAPGRHRLTVRVDNALKLNLRGHQISDDTQTNWNGIVGRIELQATDPVWVDEVRIDPDAQARRIHVRMLLGNRTGNEASGEIELSAKSWNASREHAVAPTAIKFEKAGPNAVIEATYELGPEALLWDEFSPALYKLSLSLKATAGEKEYADRRELNFGLREFVVRGTQFAVNGKTVFLRGKHDACVFPLTGYAPMDVEGWLRVFKIAKSYGINHYRFHSWTPPEAAFAAADIAGIYLQPELCLFAKDLGKDKQLEDYARREGRAVLQAFGNHPSFVMFALGNELLGGENVRADIIRELRALDGRFLYAQASNYDYGKLHFAAGDDYWSTFRTRPGGEGAVRGSFAKVDAPLGFIQAGPPAATFDYAKAIASAPAPVIGHEIGQYQVFPNFKEIEKYTGVVRAWNYEVFRERLRARGMLDQADDFFKASGALVALSYRAEIEAALRTPGFGGFQLLDLQDFPGQGTALVGILDAFMDSKGLIEPQTWREFCSETVPLALLPKYTWTVDETLTVEVKVANYGPATIPSAFIDWNLKEAGGKALAAGELPAMEIAQGGLAAIGRISAPLAQAGSPCKLLLTLEIRDTPFRNQYELWVYPAQSRTATPPNVRVRRALDEETQGMLAAGERVLLMPEPKRLKNSVEGFFASDFWCFPMFRRKGEAPGTLGLLCDPRHPALSQFPTEFHSNWQWWHLVMNSASVILDETPADFRPIVQVIDNFDKDRNHKLGLIFECRVGEGRLLVCASDLPALQDKPEARQLLASLLAYAASDQFAPEHSLPMEILKNLLVEKPMTKPEQ